MPIPLIMPPGFILQLAEPWHVEIPLAKRNETFLLRLKKLVKDQLKWDGTMGYFDYYYNAEFTFPIDTTLQVGRYHLTNRHDPFHAVYFSHIAEESPLNVSGTFWLKLKFVNEMIFNYKS